MQLLVVEPNPMTRHAICKDLERLYNQIHAVATVRANLPLLQQHSDMLVLLSWPLSDSNGLELLRHLYANQMCLRYIILLVATDAQEELIQGLQAGADDYLIKPLNLKELRRRVILGMRIIRFRSRLQQAEQQIDYLRTHDLLSGLLTRQALLANLSASFTHALHEHTPLSLALLRIDGLPQINAHYGTIVGDQIIGIVAQTIRQTIRQQDVVGRWNGTTVLLVLPGTSGAAARSVATRIQRAIAAAVVYRDGKPLRVSVHIGVASTDQQQSPTLISLLRYAAIDLAQAYHTGAQDEPR